MIPRAAIARATAGSMAGAIALAGIPAHAVTADPRIDAFRAACVDDRADFDALSRHAVETGWSPAKAGAHAELDAVLEASAEVELDPGMTASLESFGKQVADREAFLVLTLVTSEAIDLVGCYLYDFDAALPIAPDIVADWLGAPPTDSIDEPEVIVGHTWEAPAALPGTWDVYLAFIPDSGPANLMTGFSGVLIKITSVDPKED